MVNKEVSEYMANLARKRKDKNRGFNMPGVQEKALETRMKNKIKKAEEV